MSQPMTPDAQPVRENRVLTFPCPGCGANLSFDPGTQHMKCAYCGTEVEPPQTQTGVEKHRLDEADERAEHDWGKEVESSQCTNCGATVLHDARQQADVCVFCGSARITQVESAKGLLPEGILPFRVPVERAAEGFKQWVRKRFWAPNDFKKSVENGHMQGVYVPYWLYDAQTESRYTAERGDYYTVMVPRTVVRDGKTETEMVPEQRVRWTPVSGSYSRGFEDEPVHASRHIVAAKLRGMDFDSLVPYASEYLSGFNAERYSVALHDGWRIGEQQMDSKLRHEITEQIGGDEVRSLNVQTQKSNVLYRHVLVPAWIASYRYRNKSYAYVVNGRSGAVSGDSPVSKVKVAIAVVLGLVLIAVLYYFLSQSEGGGYMYY